MLVGMVPEWGGGTVASLGASNDGIVRGRTGDIIE